MIYPCPVSKEEGMNRERLITTLWRRKMKTKIFTLCGIFFVVTALILVNVVPAMANSPHTEGSSTHNSIQLVPPLSDPSKANYHSITINNLLDPNNPNYDPSGIDRLKSTPFSSPDNTKSSIISPMDTTDHLWWGTNIGTNSNLFGVYAYQSIYNTISLYDDGDALFAPTMRAPNGDPLELVTAYTKSGTTTNSFIQLYSFYYSNWDDVQIPIDSTFISNYVRSGDYVGELLPNSGNTEWHAYLYNWNTSTWDGIGSWEPNIGNTMGWDMWEEWYLADAWPTLPEIQSNYLTVRVGNSGNDWERVTSTYGSVDTTGTMTSEYPYGFLYNYYEWYVGPSS